MLEICKQIYKKNIINIYILYSQAVDIKSLILKDLTFDLKLALFY